MVFGIESLRIHRSIGFQCRFGGHSGVIHNVKRNAVSRACKIAKASVMKNLTRIGSAYAITLLINCRVDRASVRVRTVME